MQRFSALWSSRDRSKPNSGTANAAANIANAWTRRHVREDYWPTTLDRETEKAARILQSFCTENYTAPQDGSPISRRSSTTSLRTKKKIPPRIVQNAVGLAIFSCMRSGLWKSGSGGSGILVARMSDGRWSPPSAFLLHTAALGFVIGVDVYDCVLVINTISDLEIFMRPSTTLGADVELAVGPIMSEGRVEYEPQTKDMGRSVLTYVKARGEHRAINIDGSLVAERPSENDRFYNRSVSVHDILRGEVPQQDAPGIRTLYEVLKYAEGRVDFDSPLLEKLSMQTAPGDALIEDVSSLTPLSPGPAAFGVPDVDDPDPFGVKALEMAGLEIREAGTLQRPTSTQFEYNPSPNSPLSGQFNNRQSVDTYNTQSNRGSYMSNKTTFSRMTDAFTQTTVDTRGTTPTSEEGPGRISIDKLPVVIEPEDIDYTQVDETVVQRLSQEQVTLLEPRDVDEAQATEGRDGDETVMVYTESADDDAAEELSRYPVDERDEDADDEDEDESDDEIDADDEDDEDDEDEVGDNDEEEPVVYEVYGASTTAQPVRAAIVSSQVTQIIHAKGALVNIPKRVAPPVPPRSPARSSCFSRSEFGDIPMKSPLRNSFQSGMTSQSIGVNDMMSLDGVVDTPAEVATQVIPASPAEQGAETPESEKNMSHGHDRESSIYTTIIENRLSMDDLPKTPSTLQTSGQTTSGDELEPRTPKPDFEAVSTPQDDKFSNGEVRGFDINVEAD